MHSYDPLKTPDPDAWLQLDEVERIALVEKWHKGARIPLPNSKVHAIFHVIIENQLVEHIPEVEQAMVRLKMGGLDRHDSIHALATCATDEIWELSHGKNVDDSGEKHESYLRRVRAMTAQKWLKEYRQDEDGDDDFEDDDED
ncbi:MAG TPA: hypothetical protein VKX17_26535 [Planctomycetota bacterium]|nr:hypothetical protein [Planctomycetota bacterium]